MIVMVPQRGLWLLQDSEKLESPRRAMDYQLKTCRWISIREILRAQREGEGDLSAP